MGFAEGECHAFAPDVVEFCKGRTFRFLRHGVQIGKTPDQAGQPVAEIRVLDDGLGNRLVARAWHTVLLAWRHDHVGERAHRQPFRLVQKVAFRRRLSGHGLQSSALAVIAAGTIAKAVTAAIQC